MFKLNHGNSGALTRKLSTGRVTLNLSIVLTMMAGVVRKKSSRKSRMLRRTQRSHQRDPHTDRFSLMTGQDKHLNSWLSNRNVNPPQLLSTASIARGLKYSDMVKKFQLRGREMEKATLRSNKGVKETVS